METQLAGKQNYNACSMKLIVDSLQDNSFLIVLAQYKFNLNRENLPLGSIPYNDPMLNNHQDVGRMTYK